MKNKYLKATIITNAIFYLLFLSLLVAPPSIVEFANLFYLIILAALIVLVIIGFIILVKSNSEDRRYIIKGLFINFFPILLVILSILLLGLTMVRPR